MPDLNDHGKFSRRRLIQMGGLGLVGLGLPELLRADATRGGTAKSCIFIVQYGGGTQLDTWDPKPDAPEKIRGPYRPIATRTPGMQISEMLPRLASISDRYSLVRSMTHQNGGHQNGMHVCLSGQSNGSDADNTPYFGSVVSRLRPATQNIPSYVWIQNLAGDVGKRYEAGGALGLAYSPLRVGTDLDNPAAETFRMTAFDPPPGVDAGRLRNRQSLLDTIEPRDAISTRRPSLDFRKFQERALELVSGAEARQAFDLTRESDSTRAEYGMHPLGQNLLMARRMIEAGTRLVSVTAWTGLPPGEAFRNVQTWDMHSVVFPGSDTMYGKSAFGLGWALPRVDQSVSALLLDLEERGLLDSTLVVMVGEFGRSPQFEAQDKGRAHWPYCYSAMLAGGGMRGGAVYGASDQNAGYVKDKPVSPENFGATLYHALGVPPETRFGPDGFSLRVSAGEPVYDLLG